MHNTGKSIAFIMGLIAIGTPLVSKADAPRGNFSGFYLGGNIGVASGHSNYLTNPGCVSPAEGGVFCVMSPDPSYINGLAVSNSGSGKISSRGFTGGAEAGHNWQIDRVVFGGEADFGALNLKKSVHASGMFPFAFLGNSYSLGESMSTNWLATIRGRVGLSVHPQLLLYGTSGAAFTSYHVSSSYNDNAVSADFPGGSGSGRLSRNRTGWTAGGGAEWLFTEHFSVKAEYLYVDFGSVNVLVPLSNTPAFTQTMQVKSDLSTNIVRLGLNYQFDGITSYSAVK
ncbi:MAG: outer membrane beta-barrel protein [Legionella sp.]|nr:outer membrane beta-barrel protein [Legionella sp.]